MKLFMYKQQRMIHLRFCFDLYTKGNVNFSRNITVGETKLRNPTGKKYCEINRYCTSFIPRRGDQEDRRDRYKSYFRSFPI